jgi:hypothetical protein
MAKLVFTISGNLGHFSFRFGKRGPSWYNFPHITGFRRNKIMYSEVSDITLKNFCRRMNTEGKG